ncbi:hypothetical protein Pisl_1543 [Pyrobaculum islandicum DSM 4184]|uniref:CRISPR type III-associated protein domain-containing protein n=1 Tax=Pyrobaculum islandicum (strain DSM 4184 / JCM 9189 / GEO3) TaxID=384616 RepID=A1RUR6_PYRIL|nr:hypothetical protein [Pyrobaculum islandicum]ABL88698.1 hypothetical protein Pisl_1543 [Pyrobaculum islandicum DSM 4184]
MTDFFLVEFFKGYHVGWREVTPVVDHTSILRALIYVAHMIGDLDAAKKIEEGQVRATGLFPVVGENLPLVPFPHIPSKSKEVRYLWATLGAVEKVLRVCSGSEDCFVKETTDDKVKVRNLGKRKTLELKRTGPVVYDEDVHIEVSGELYEVVVEYRNRLDRATPASDVFIVEWVRPRTKLWLAIEGLDNADALLGVLGEVGLGGMRSRGWGRFSVERLDSTYRLEGLDGGWRYLLGSYPFLGCIEKAYGREVWIEGYSGPPYNSYMLPRIRAISPGGVVKAKEKCDGVVLSYVRDEWREEKAESSATVVFNPLTYGI